MSAFVLTRTETPEGGHSGPPKSGLEKPPSVTYETELWRLPADWRVVPLREAYSFTKKPRWLTIPLDGTIPFLPMDAIPIGRVSVSAFEERPSSKLTSGTYIENGDLIVAKITPSFENGKQAIVKWDRPFGFATTEVIPIQEIEGISDKRYLFHILLHPEIRADLAGKMDGTTGRQRLSKEVLGAKQIPLPPLAEQRKIAAVLGVVQRAMEQQERLLALTAELKKTLLHQLFTQGLRGEPQKQTDVGLVPESWKVVNLGNLGTKISKGSSPRWQGFEYVPEGVLFVRSQNVGFGRMEFSDRVFVPTGFNEHEKRSILKNEDILINLVGASIGRVALGTPEIEGANCNQAVGFVRLEGDRSFKAFIVYYLLSPIGQRQMFFQKKDIARANLSLLDLRSFKVPVPSPEETAEIAQILDETERKIEICERTKTALSDLFRTLLHQLMTAQIRVNDLEVATELCRTP